MANGNDDASASPDFPLIVDNVLAGLGKYVKQDNVKDTIAAGLLSAHGGAIALIIDLGVELAVKLGKTLSEGEDVIMPVLAGFIAPLVANMFGSDVDASAFASRANSGARTAASKALVGAFLQALEGSGGDIVQPGREGATRVAAAALNATLEGWFMGAVPELVSDLFPADWLHFTEFTKLPEDVIHSLGIGRLVRRVLSPLVDAVAAEPMRWDVNKTYRPKLLGESTALRQFLRGKWDWSDVAEELARLGYTDERIDALLNEQVKRLPEADLASLVWLELLSLDDATQTMRDLGWDEQNASKHFQLRTIEREDALHKELATEAIAAFVDRRIEEADLVGILGTTITAQHERDILLDVARGKQLLNVKFLSSTQAADCVKAEILAYPDYRAALAREGYDSDAIDALELLLRSTVDTKKSTAQHKADVAAAKQTAADQKAAAAAAKKTQIDQARALKAQGSISELEHAVITGLIPIDRLVQVLTPQFDADTVQIYVADVTQKRAAYVAQQQKQAAAAARATNKGLNTSQLEQAVYDNDLTLDAFTAAMTAKGIDPADAALLTKVVAAKKADLDAAAKKHAEAAQRAAQKHISLAKFEQLVELGHRTMADYDALLVTLNYDDASRAALEELLQTKLDARAAAGTLRAGIAAANPTKGISLEQARRAVILGEQTIDWFSNFLLQTGYTADAASVLIAELTDDAAAAAAARTKRTQGDTTGGGTVVALTVVAKAARLGVITTDAYQARLAAAGYSPDDIALEMDLLVAEMSKAAGTKATTAAAPAPTAPPASSLDALAAQVKVGAATLSDYRQAAISSGLSDADVTAAVTQLQDELDVLAAAKTRRDAIAAQLAPTATPLEPLEASVRSGALTVVALEAQLEAIGIAAVDAQFVGALLEAELAAHVA